MFPLVLPQVIPKNELEKWLHDSIIFHSVPANRQELIKVLKKYVNGGQLVAQSADTTTWVKTLTDSETEHHSLSEGEGDGAGGGDRWCRGVRQDAGRRLPALGAKNVM